MIRLIRNLLSKEWMYGPLMNVRVSKVTGRAERLYIEIHEKTLGKPKGLRREVWRQVDGVTLRPLPCGRLALVPKEDRFWTAQSAL